MNISEFERTKPVETMKTLNVLIKKIEQLINDSADIDIDRELMDILGNLKDIKKKLKNGE